MTWTAATKPAVGAPTKKSEIDALIDRLNHLLSASDTWNTSGIATGNGLAGSGRPGLMSAALFGRLGTLHVVTGTYSGTGTVRDQTIASGETLVAVFVVGAYDGSNDALWVQLGAASECMMIRTDNTIRSDGHITLNSASAGLMALSASSLSPNVSSKTYTYLAIIA